MTCDAPTPLQLVAIGLWIRSGVTTDVARALVGASSLDFERWVLRGREDLATGTASIYVELVRKIEIADALRRGEVQRAIHVYVLRNPERALDYIQRRWPDALADSIATIAAAPASTRSLVDSVLDVAARIAAAGAGEEDDRQLEPGRAGNGGVVDDEPPDPHDG